MEKFSWESRIALVVLVLLVFQEYASSLRCHQCAIARCGTSEELVECSDKVINHLYDRMQPMADLFALEPTTRGKYSCFQVVLSDGNHTAMVKGCTYRESNICTGWNDGISVQECHLCDASDYCNGFESEMESNGARERAWWRNWMVVVAAVVTVLFAI
nr:uncharacterized protein LOC115268737 [Aedes albopictus]